jgi:uncharacterized membrane protein
VNGPAGLSRLRPAPGDDRGTIVIWLLGLCVVLLCMGGVSLDLWRVLSERRALAGVADAASIAGATGVDEAAFRSTGAVRLDVGLAEQRARASLLGQADVGPLTGAGITATPEAVTVVLTGSVPLTLLRVLVPDAGAIDLQVRAVAGPRRG